MRTIHAKLPSGYGDVLRFLTYFSQVSYTANTQIELIFHHRSPYEKKNPENAESPGARLYALHNMFDTKLAYLSIEIDENPLKQDDDVSMYKLIGQGGMMKTVWKTQKDACEKDHAVIWLPNRLPLRKQSKKNTVPEDRWNALLAWLESQTTVYQIDYNTPISDVIELVRTAKICFGYEGIGQFISKQYFKPIVTIHNQKGPSLKHGGDWGTVNDDIDDRLLQQHINQLVNYQKPTILYKKQMFDEMIKQRIF